MEPKKKSVVDVVLVSVITFVVGFVMQSFSTYLTQESGAVFIGPAFVAEKQLLLPIDVNNYQKKRMDNLRLEVPVSFDVNRVIASSPVSVESLPMLNSDSGLKTISISGIKEHALVRVVLPLKNQSDVESVGFVNLKELGVSVLPTSDLKSPLQQAYKDIAASSLLMALLYAVFVHLLARKIDADIARTEERIRKVESSTEEGRKHSVLLEGMLKEREKTYAKIRILLMSRLADHEKELGFWRNTVRKVMCTNGSFRSAETLISQVTAQLKTYSTLNDKEFLFEEAKVLAGYLKDNEVSRCKEDVAENSGKVAET